MLKVRFFQEHNIDTLIMARGGGAETMVVSIEVMKNVYLFSTYVHHTVPHPIMLEYFFKVEQQMTWNEKKKDHQQKGWKIDQRKILLSFI